MVQSYHYSVTTYANAALGFRAWKITPNDDLVSIGYDHTV
jgi:hypothetical protein